MQYLLEIRNAVMNNHRVAFRGKRPQEDAEKRHDSWMLIVSGFLPMYGVAAVGNGSRWVAQNRRRQTIVCVRLCIMVTMIE